jgi:hypothetical protein
MSCGRPGGSAWQPREQEGRDVADVAVGVGGDNTWDRDRAREQLEHGDPSAEAQCGQRYAPVLPGRGLATGPGPPYDPKEAPRGIETHSFLITRGARGGLLESRLGRRDRLMRRSRRPPIGHRGDRGPRDRRHESARYRM